MEDDLISLAELARRIGYGATWVRRLAGEDPAFPPRRRIGNAWVVSWAEAQRYFANRDPKIGRPPHRDPS